MKALPLILLAALAPACHNPPKSGAAAEFDEVVDDKGYFVTLASKSSAPEAQHLYDKLYDALDSHSRKQAKAGGKLDAYVEEFQQSGFTSLKDGDDEIECDRDKCLFKLHARRISKQEASAERPPFTQQLFAALLDAGVPVTTGAAGLVRHSAERDGGQVRHSAERDGGDAAADDFVKTASLGETKGVRVACSERRTAAGVPIDYGCAFDLDGLKGDAVARPAAMEGSEKGKLSSCVLAPGIVKAAEEAKASVEGGGLLTLTAGAAEASKPVGYLRYTRSGASVELLDLFLCGDLSQDTFYLSGAGKIPRMWVAGLQKSSPGATGAVSVDIEPAHHDEGDLTMRASVVGQTAKEYTLEVQFKVVKDAGVGDAVFGEDRFFVKVDKSWLK